MNANNAPLSLAAIVEQVARFYAAVGPHVCCTFVEPEMLLVVAGLRADANLLVFEPTQGDEEAVQRLNAAMQPDDLQAKLAEETITNANGRPCRTLLIDNLAGYAYVSRQTGMRGVSVYDAATGRPGWEHWYQDTLDGLKANYEPDPILWDRWLGLLLGYPDCAIDALCRNLTAGRWGNTGLVSIEIPGMRRYPCALPSFSYDRADANDPQLVNTVKT